MRFSGKYDIFDCIFVSSAYFQATVNYSRDPKPVKNIKMKLFKTLVTVILLILTFTGIRGQAFADNAAGWDEMSFEAQNNYKI